MATQHEIVGEEWHSRASELAQWTMDHLVNRKDVWGQYSVLTPSERRREGRSYKAMTLPVKDKRGGDMVTMDKLTRHYASRHNRKPQIIGLHAKSKEGTSKWLGIDIDCHDLESSTAEDHIRRNLNTSIKWWKSLQDLGYDPLLFDSNGAGGGYHLWILFAEPAPTVDVFAFAKSIVSNWQSDNLDEEPETFPKRYKPESLGSWFRLPGLHHTREHYSTVWSGDEWLSDPWLSGHAAIDTLLQNIPGPPPPKASEEDIHQPRTTRRSSRVNTDQPTPTAASRRRSFSRTGKAKVCVDLDGVLCSRKYVKGKREFGEPVDGAVDFLKELSEFAKVIIFSSRLGASDDPTSEDMQTLHDAIEHWLDRHNFSYDEICTDRAKPIASAYVDDRGVACRPEVNGVNAFQEAMTHIETLCNE